MTEELPQAKIKTKSTSFSPIWVIPIIAALIGGWLVFQSAIEKKIFKEVTFNSASGLEAGKTAVRLRNIKVGIVTDVKFSDDLSEVIVVMEFTGITEERITDTSRFWVVRPRIGLEGISGLDTLLSGAYIEIDPGKGGDMADKFTGHEEPQNYQLGNPGTTYRLSSNQLGSLSRGSPIQYKGVDVGAVTRYKLVEDHSHVEIEIFIRAPHDKFVTDNSRFWNTSGFEVELGAKGFTLDMDSVASIVAGGVAFSNSGFWTETKQASENSVYKLHDDKEVDIEEVLTYGAQMKLYFDDGVSGLSIGAPVEYKGLRLGTVTEIAVESNKSKTDILTYAMIDIEPERLPTDDQLAGLTKQQRIEEVYRYFKNMMKNGLKAQLKGNILTGQSLVNLDFFQETKNRSVKYVEGVFVLPTAPESLSGILQQVNSIMAKIEAMPLDKIGRNLDEATANINSLVKSLNAAEGGMTGVQVGEVMDELTKAARSIRSMSEYLERHPEALLKGKKSE